MEPRKQVEIQLGHMCNNRCVFCVSGQRTAMGEAGPMQAAPILARLDEAYASGHRKLTLLGGEPTLQPSFMEVLRHATQLGFEEIVLFTNGVRTARAALVDEILATGAPITWRISIQGATEEAHENTTKKRGSFRRIVRTLEHLKAREQPITVNMCVVNSNLASVPHFAELLLPYGVHQLHLDMMRPADAGQRDAQTLIDLMPRLSDYEAPMTAMAAAFEERARDLELDDFDLNIGNLPYCVAPSLLHRIHHDGEHTETIAIDHDDQLSKPWNKYLVKRHDKVHASGCADCVMRDRCNGVFDRYAETHGLEELRPITLDQLAEIDPERGLLVRHLRPMLRALSEHMKVRTLGDENVELTLAKDDASLRVLLARPGTNGEGRYEAFVVSTMQSAGAAQAVFALARELNAHLASHRSCVVPYVPRELLAPTTRTRLVRLTERAPFGQLIWHGAEYLDDGSMELAYRAPHGSEARVLLSEREGRPVGSYRLVDTPRSGDETHLREGLTSVIGACAARQRT